MSALFRRGPKLPNSNFYKSDASHNWGVLILNSLAQIELYIHTLLAPILLVFYTVCLCPPVYMDESSQHKAYE